MLFYSLFTQTSQDEIPQVRKCSSLVLHDMIKLVPQVPDTDLLNIFANFYQDEQDSIRMQSIDSIIYFSKVLPMNKINQSLIPYIKKFSVDKSWRIRYLVADKIMEISNGIGLENSKEHLTSFYCQFLEDTESEVRTAAVRRLSDFGKIIDPKILI
jgi:serine/threonine-protein phosphatase 2A regulatory subunit A